MNEQIRFHPCFSCILPDCDERSRDCVAKKALNTYRHRYENGLPISDELLLRKRFAYRELYGSAHDERERSKRMGIPTEPKFKSQKRRTIDVQS